MNCDINSSLTNEANEILEYINNCDLTYEPLESFKNICEYISGLNVSLTNSLIVKLFEKEIKICNLLDIVVDNFNEFSNIKFNNVLSYEIATMLINIYTSNKNSEEIQNINIDYFIGDTEFMQAKDYEDNYKLYIKDVNKYKILTKEETELLMEEIKLGNKEAQKKFICSYLRFVISIAKNYRGYGLEFMDLIQEGNIGLIKAIKHYDHSKGFSFSNYAYYWVRCTITRAIREKSRNIRIPVSLCDNILKYNKAILQLEEEFYRTPTIEELQKKLNFSKEYITILEENKVDTVSLNKGAFNGDAKENELIDLIADKTDFVNDKIIPSMMKQHFQILFKQANLTDKEIAVLILYYGLNGTKMNFAKIAEIYDVSRERIRKIHENAIKKIRTSDYINNFIQYMDDPKGSEFNLKIYKKIYF